MSAHLDVINNLGVKVEKRMASVTTKEEYETACEELKSEHSSNIETQYLEYILEYLYTEEICLKR